MLVNIRGQGNLPFYFMYAVLFFTPVINYSYFVLLIEFKKSFLIQTSVELMYSSNDFEVFCFPPLVCHSFCTWHEVPSNFLCLQMNSSTINGLVHPSLWSETPPLASTESPLCMQYISGLLIVCSICLYITEQLAHGFNYHRHIDLIVSLFFFSWI